MRVGDDWTRSEVERVVDDYLEMLTLELSGQTYHKAQRRRALVQRLPARSEGSIEFERCNVSAVMIQIGFPYLSGYQPRSNFQPLQTRVKESEARFSAAIRRDYLERESRNRSLGQAGELFALRFERWRLAQAGQEHLAARVEHALSSVRIQSGAASVRVAGCRRESLPARSQHIQRKLSIDP